MDRTMEELSHLVTKHFSMHPARLRCFLALIFAVIGAKSVQLWALAEQFGGSAHPESRIKRIKRFLQNQILCQDSTSHLIMALTALQDPVTLVMDRTNWKFGTIERNYLVLSVVYRKCAIAILSVDLERAGNSETQDRINLLKRFISLFGLQKIHCLLADREFIGEEWFKWLQSMRVPICIRQKSNLQVKHKNGGKVPVSRYLQSLDIGQKREWIETFYGTKMKMVGLKLGDGDYLILLADLSFETDLLPLYKIRWTIECLFKNMKSSGFNLELTHLKHADRAHKIFAIISIATAIAVKEGAIQNSLKPIPIKKTLGYPAISLFNYGLKYLADFIRNISNIINYPFLHHTLKKTVP